jgi:hypothetical protein
MQSAGLEIHDSIRGIVVPISMGTVAHFNKRCQHSESRLPKWICACLHSRRYVGATECRIVTMSCMRRRVRTGFRCAATCREPTPTLLTIVLVPCLSPCAQRQIFLQYFQLKCALFEFFSRKNCCTPLTL